MRITAVRCARRELRNCHFRGNFVTEAAHYLGAAEMKRHNAVTPFATNYSKTTLPSQLCCATLPCTGRAGTPTVTALPRHLPQRGRQVIITRASKIAFCARAPHLRIPALVATRRILWAFDYADCRTFYVCRSSSRKSFRRKYFRDCCGTL